MKKLYEFHELSEKAKKKAVTGVFDVEREDFHDWSFESENITESIQYYLGEKNLEYGDIYWDSNYGVNVDLGTVKMTDEFIKEILSEDDYKKYEELYEVSSGYLTHELFSNDFESDGYAMNFEYNGLDEQETMEFIMKYEEDEEVKAKFKFPLIMDEELSSEMYEELEYYGSKLGERLAEELGDQINKVVSEIHSKIVEMIREGCDYMGSEEYYRDSLEGGGYEADVYLFSFSGEAIMKDDKYLDKDFEGQFILKAS